MKEFTDEQIRSIMDLRTILSDYESSRKDFVTIKFDEESYRFTIVPHSINVNRDIIMFYDILKQIYKWIDNENAQRFWVEMWHVALVKAPTYDYREMEITFRDYNYTLTCSVCMNCMF